MKEYISKDEIIEHFSKRVSCPSGEDNSKERYRYIQWVTDYNSIISIPAVKAIPIPKGGTNGDMIKTMFPNEEIVESDGACVYVGVMMRFDKDWWNAPYESEEP